MTKKLIALAGAGALLLGTIAPVMAWGYQWPWMGGGDTNTANVTNNVGAYSSTGYNTQVGGKGMQLMFTGNSYAGATATTLANTDVGCCGEDEDCGCEDENTARVTNNVGAYSSTGYNTQMSYGGGWCWGGSYQEMWTGHSGAEAAAFTVVNTELF